MPSDLLSYPLSPIPLCLSTADGKPRKTAKSKLQEVVLKKGDSTIVDNPQDLVGESRHNSSYFVDLLAELRSVVQISENYEELTQKPVQLRLEKDKVVDAVITLSLNRLSPGNQKSFNIFSEMVKIRTGSKICFVKQYPALNADYGNGKNRKGV